LIYRYRYRYRLDIDREILTMDGLEKKSRALVAHTCNCSYSGDRDEEDCGSKLAQAKKNFTKKKVLHKKGLVEWFKV
jgi:hypothetical protein